MNDSDDRELLCVNLWSDNGPEVLCAWPMGLPRSFDELFRDYGKFIADKVKSYNKVARNIEDLHQEICCKLIGSDLLNKFFARALRQCSLPTEINAKEARAMLGMTRDEFILALYWGRQTEEKRLVNGRVRVIKIEEPASLDFLPVNDVPSVYDENAVFTTADIFDLDDAYKGARSERRRITWPIQALGFKAYLTQAIHNHFANWCRTRKRKYQDLLLPETAVVQSMDSGAYRQLGHNFEATDWESRLVSMAMVDEDMLTVAEAVRDEFEALGLDPSVMTQRASDGRPTEAAMQALELLDAMTEQRAVHPEAEKLSRRGEIHWGDGRTLREAVKVRQRAEIRARARIAAE